MPEEFNNQTLTDNITYLLKELDKKIGEFEAEVGVSPGYISRISKDGGSKPGIDFIINAASALRISIDLLLKHNLTHLTPNEKYLIPFLEKLSEDTLEDKLDWNTETSSWLNRGETDLNGNPTHPLFISDTFMSTDENGFPEEVTNIVFDSHTYGRSTTIEGNCFNVRLKNGAVLYLMNVSDSEDIFNLGESGKEIWMVVPYSKPHFLVSSKGSTSIAGLVDSLYTLVDYQMKKPRVKKEIKYVIDAYMKDDLSDDDSNDSVDDDDIPFN